MSIDIKWETLTAGSDGEELAETIKAFLHGKFQEVPLPRFIRSVEVQSFEFGTVSPEMEVRDVCDPLPDFYEQDSLDGADDDEEEDDNEDDVGVKESESKTLQNLVALPNDQSLLKDGKHPPKPPGEGKAKVTPAMETRPGTFRNSLNLRENPISPIFSGPQSSGIPGGTSNLAYFHLPLGVGLSGSTTPLAAVAGARFHHGWQDDTVSGQSGPQHVSHQHSTSISSLTPTSSADPMSRPSSRHRHDSASQESADEESEGHYSDENPELPPVHSPNDLQLVFRVRYSGDMKLVLTAEILLDYPMESFVGIPLKLHITGLTFDGVAILASIKNRLHVCFLSPEDAEVYLGPEDAHVDDESSSRQGRIGGLLEEIKVESEIGQKGEGKQVLKNVGKVEKFVLEQVRRILEDELVFPNHLILLV